MHRQSKCNISSNTEHRAGNQLSMVKLSLYRVINSQGLENQLLFDYIVAQKSIQVSSNISRIINEINEI